MRIFDAASPLRIPKLTAGATVGFVGEGELIPEADVDFGEVTLMPSTRKSLKTLIRFTNELVGSFIRDGSPRGSPRSSRVAPPDSCAGGATSVRLDFSS